MRRDSTYILCTCNRTSSLPDLELELLCAVPDLQAPRRTFMHAPRPFVRTLYPGKSLQRFHAAAKSLRVPRQAWTRTPRMLGGAARGGFADTTRRNLPKLGDLKHAEICRDLPRLAET